MPRLFWKLFFALWLSIMAFAVVVSWINQTVILQYAVEEPGRGFEVNLKRFKARLAQEMGEGGEQQVKRTLHSLQRGMRNHIFIVDSDGNELLGREDALKKLRRGRVKVSRKQLVDADGQFYTLISTGRRPPPCVLL